MSQISHIAERVVTFLEKRDAPYCESCLVERLLIASRTAMKAALELDCFTVQIGVCPDCRNRKQVIAHRAGARKAARAA